MPDAKTRAEQTADRRARNRAIPVPGKPKSAMRRKSCARDLMRFASTYFPARFVMEFSDDHRRVLGLAQSAILGGGQFAVAMPRGSGKTTMMEVACLWAILYGHRRFIVAVACDGLKALGLCASMRAELEHNELLAEDFPDAVLAIRALGGVSRRAEGQTMQDGRRTFLVWTKDEVRLPMTAAGGGSIIRTAGITAGIRGAKAVLADGSQVRPDLVLVDDPQTDESARSPSQVQTRMSTLNGTVMGLAGPGKQIACLCTCTVIEKGDVADKILDRKEHPEWQGYRARLLRSFPKRTDLWDKYGETYRECLRVEKPTTEATAFYRENQAAMDEGAEASWPQRKLAGELTAIQHAMNLMIRHGHPAFMAEYQNEPQDMTASADVVQLTPAAIVRKLNQHDRGVIPIEDTIVTAGIDVQGACLYWALAAWTPEFSGDVIEYGTYPDQGRAYFSVREVEKTMAKEHPGASWEASLYASLDALCRKILGAVWNRDDGTLATVDQVVIDAGYGTSTDTIYEFCRRSDWRSSVLPFFGRSIGAGQTPMGEWKKKPGDRIGPDWRIPKPGARQTRHILADVNAWKSFVADRLLTQHGDAGCLSLFGSQPSAHRMIADHLCAEYRTKVSANGRTSDEWRVRPNADNHLLDCLVHSAVGASIRGARLDPNAVVIRPTAESVPTANEQAAPAARPSPPITTPRPKPNRRGPGGGFMTGFGLGGF